MSFKKLSCIIILFLLSGRFPLQASKTPLLLREGLEFRQVEGTARINERTKAWRFVTHKRLQDHNITIPTGTELTILPCANLDKIMTYAGKDQFVSIRIDAIVTRYRNTNFLFIFSVTPLKKVAEESIHPDTTSQSNSEPEPEKKINIIKMATDPNETSVIPLEILQQMKPKRKTDFARMQEATRETEILDDTMIVSRTGQFACRNKTCSFVLDGFGQNISGRSFSLLPCQTLEQTEKQLKQAFGRQRYRVSGIVTTFRGKSFLLLQGAVRTHTYGNFTP